MRADERLAHRLLDRAARLRPDAPAVRDAHTRLTYRQTAAASRRVAAWLASAGVRPGGRVLVRHPNAAALVPLLFGVARAGAVFVPVSPAMSGYQLRTVVADAAPDLVLSTGAEAGLLRELTDRPVVPLDTAWTEAAGAPDDDVDHATPDGLALLVYTSGTTAAPKAVMCPHRQVAFAVGAVAARLGYGPDDAVFCKLPMSFDYGMYQALLCAHGGSELQLAHDGDEAGLLRRVRDWGATVIPVVPALAAMLVDLARRGTDTGSVRLLTNTGAALSPATAAALRQHFPNARLCLMYGITECKRVSIMEPDGDLLRPGSVGRPLDGTTVAVVGPDRRALPPGGVGEIVVSGPHVTSGYWRAPGPTEERFGCVAGEPILHTGDQGWVDGDGYLYFAGRHDEIFKRRGTRVSTVEIEAAAMDIPGVRTAAVPRPAQDGELVVCVVTDLGPAQVLAGLAERLERVKLPDACHVLPELPLGPNGKVDKARLVGLISAGDPR